MKVLIRALAARLQRLSPRTVTALGICLVIALGLIDYYTPGSLTFVLYYMLVAVLVGWRAGKWHAVFIAGVSAITMATVHWGLSRSTPQLGWMAVWNTSTRFLVFSIAGWLTAEVTRLTRHLSNLVEERTAQWKAEAEQHKATSTRLTEALERFEQVTNNITEVFWLTNVAKTQMAYVSPAYERLWGRKCEELYREPMTWAAAIHPDDRDAVLRRAQTDQADGGYDVEYRILRPDGAVRWIRDRAFPVRNEQGVCYRIAGLAQDITEWKQTQEMLQTQAAILESMAEGVVVTDEQGVIVQMNQAGEQIWGYERNEVLGQQVSLLSGTPEPEAKAVMREVLAALHTKGSWRGTFQNRRKDGTSFVFEAVINRLEVQGRMLMVAVEQDVTERLRDQEQLQIQARVLQSMAEAALMADDAGTIVLTNPALDALLGYQAGELTGKSLELLTTLASATYRPLLEAVVKQARAGDSVTGEYVARRKNGALIQIEARGSGLLFGERFFLVLVGQDITQRKQAETVLRESEQTYRALVETTGTGYLILDLEGRVLDANDEYVRLSGHKTLPQILGRSVAEWTAPNHRDQNAAALAECLKTGGVTTLEIDYAGPNGPITPVEINATAVQTSKGRTILALCRGITERKRAELTKEVFLTLGEKLSSVQTPEEAARAIFASADLFWQWDSATLDLWSPESGVLQTVLNCDLIDGQRREVSPLPMTGAPTARMRRIMRDGAELLLRRETELHDTEAVRFGDVSRPSASLMSVPMRQDGTPVGVLSIQSYTLDAFTQEDLRTLQALADYCGGALERIRTEQALQQRVELNRTILATAMDGFYALDFAADPRGAIVAVNDAYCRLLGYDREELVQMRIADLEAKETAEEVTRHKARIMATGADRFETRHWRKDGREVQVEISLSKLADSNERVFGFVRDITERKRAELLKETFLSLGAKLSAVRTPVEAARAIYASADLLWKWDSATLDLWSPESGVLQSVLNYDLIDGQRREIPPVQPRGTPSARMLRIMREGPELILERQPTRKDEFVMFGDTSRFSASIMHVPLRQDGRAVGVLAIQSYTPDAYTQEDLRTLQALADHCAGALERISAELALSKAHDQLERRVAERTAELQVANEALVSSERKYRLLHESMMDAFVSVDMTGQITASNPAYQAMLGYTPDELRKLTYIDLTPEKWHAQEARIVTEQILARGYSDVYEKEYRRKDGTIFPIELRVFLIQAAHGQPATIWGIVRDITERKRAEAALREAHNTLEARVKERTAELQTANAALVESEERYRSLVTNLNVGIYRNTPGSHGRFLHVNPALARMIGFDSVEEMKQTRVIDLYQVAAEREAFLATLLRQGSVVNYELHLKKKNGIPIYGSINATIHRGQDGEVDWIDGMIKDITERKLAEQALRASEERYRALAESSPDAIFILDRNIKVQYVNTTAANLWKRPPAELLGVVQSELFPPEVAKSHARFVAEVFASGQSLRQDQLFAFPAGGQWIDIRLVPLYGEQGTVLSVMGVCRDITERKNTERQLSEALDLNQKMITASAMGIAAYRASGECVFANEAIARIVGENVSEVLHGNFRLLEFWQKSGLLQLAEEALSQGQARLGETHTTTRFGKTLWLDCHVAPFVSQGQTHLLLMALDITERKAANALLLVQRDLGIRLSLTRDLNAALNDLIEIATHIEAVDGGGIYLLDPTTGGLNLTVQRDERAAFLPAESHIAADAPQTRLVRAGQPIYMNYSPTPNSATRNPQPATERPSPGACAIVPLCYEGNILGSLNLASRHFDEFPPQARIVIEAIAAQASGAIARIRAEEALRQSEARLRTIIRGAPVRLFAVDQNGIIQFEDGQAHKALRTTPAEHLGHSVTEVYADVPDILENSRRALLGEQFEAVVQVGPMTFDSWYSPTRDKDGKPAGYIGVATNITERHRLERQILEISDREQARIGQDIHDGLCQQLVSLAFDANSLESELLAQRRPEAKKAQRIVKFLDQAITESRQLSRGLFPVRLEIEGLGSALEELAKATGERFNIRCRFINPEPLAVQNIAVATHLYRIAQEALANAVKHSRAENVTIRLNITHNSPPTHPSHSALRTPHSALPPGQIKLSVEDDGAGLSPAKRKQATGLGLHIMDYRARAIGGTLHIEANQQGGTIVSCCIPREKS